MAEKPPGTDGSPTTQAAVHSSALITAAPPSPLPDWLAGIGLGLMQTMAASRQDELADLRQRLELTQLALDTGAPLSTAEVTLLLGARPGADVVQRGGLKARRLTRNVWKLSRAGEENPGFRDSFRRRL